MSNKQKIPKISKQRKKMLYRCWHRGTQEMDLILGHFANQHLEKYNQSELNRFEKLMDEQDTDLLAWILGQQPIPSDVDAELINQLREFQLSRSNNK